MAELPLTGGCHCQALRYEINERPLLVYNCHCTNCQKTSGAAFATNVTIPVNALEFVVGEPGKIKWTSDAGSERVGFYCDSCHGRIAHGWEGDSSPVVNVRTGTLDDTSWVNPVLEMWTSSAQPWVEFSRDRIQIQEQLAGPGEFQPYFEAFSAQQNF